MQFSYHVDEASQSNAFRSDVNGNKRYLKSEGSTGDNVHFGLRNNYDKCSR
jgi:hypothetical protein